MPIACNCFLKWTLVTKGRRAIIAAGSHHKGCGTGTWLRVVPKFSTLAEFDRMKRNARDFIQISNDEVRGIIFGKTKLLIRDLFLLQSGLRMKQFELLLRP